MAPALTLGSPIELAVREPVHTPEPVTPATNPRYSLDFVKYGSPYDQSNRIFIGLDPSWNGIDAIEFQDGLAIGFLSHCKVEGNTFPLQHITQVSHRNVLGFKEIFVKRGGCFFIYGQWGTTLREIHQLLPILNGLKYIHDELGISYGGLGCSNILITQDGEVKISGIGRSLVQSPTSVGKAQDVQAVCNIARKLLDLQNATTVRGTIGLIAEDFIGASPTATVDELLRIQAMPWCLRPINTLCSIARQRRWER
ncbi:uncharacterized protein LDX57_009112 [Aspergillus melleus]|uniref:uncharacterized protein n=1 Tax=Aspergillus melleus TaxID=138277 RepID=UPI001E8EC433|nr:uncharacterized protein LDX57_009112 [Aspergillus melleus]KAH8431450.1 hypothetical protein LDX57_009112 [Aspergillus melleus]